MKNLNDRKFSNDETKNLSRETLAMLAFESFDDLYNLYQNEMIEQEKDFAHSKEVAENVAKSLGIDLEVYKKANMGIEPEAIRTNPKVRIARMVWACQNDTCKLIIGFLYRNFKKELRAKQIAERNDKLMAIKERTAQDIQAQTLYINE